MWASETFSAAHTQEVAVMFALPTQVPPLPLKSSGPQSEPVKKVVSSMANNRRVFIIEDEQDISELMRFNLALEGYMVETFSTGEAGFRTLEQRTPDLLILDIMLPGMSGLDICK